MGVVSEIVKLYDELIDVLMGNIGENVTYVWGKHKATEKGLRILIERRLKLKKEDIMTNPHIFQALEKLKALEKESEQVNE